MQIISEFQAVTTAFCGELNKVRQSRDQARQSFDVNPSMTICRTTLSWGSLPMKILY